MTTNRPLRVFLCHSSNDKPAVRELYQKLRAEPWIQPWLDEEELLGGQNFDLEINKATREADVIIICLSKSSVIKEGYVNKEIRRALDISEEKPEGVIYVIPLRLDDCIPSFEQLKKLHWVDYFLPGAHGKLLKSLQVCADSLGLKIKKTIVPKLPNKITLSNGMEFMRVPAGKFLMGSTKENKSAFREELPQHTIDLPDYWMARYPVTNGLYNVYAKAKGIKHPVAGWGQKKDHPVTYVKWTDAMEYCKWLNNNLLKAELPSGLILRLPTEAEWEKAARGADGLEYPWGNTFDKNKCNTSDGGKGGTTPVGYYSPQGDSPYGCADMSGNVWEWSHSVYSRYPYIAKDGCEDEKASGARVLRGGSFNHLLEGDARCAFRNDSVKVTFNVNFNASIGFRVVVAQPI